MTTLTEQIDASLREITKPLMWQLRDTEENIALREEELKELRAIRTRLVAIARQIDPELAPKKVFPKGKSLVPVSEGTVTETLNWLHENTNGDEFYASGLAAMEGLPSKSQLNKALNVLHERGLITLVRQGTGGSKYYRVVA